MPVVLTLLTVAKMPTPVLLLMRNGLPTLAMVTAWPELLLPPMTWMPAPLGKFWMVLLLIVPALMLAWFAPPRLATTLMAVPSDDALLVELVSELPVMVR